MDIVKKSGDRMKRNQSREDYLETIFLLGREGAPVHSADIARALKYSPVSVWNAVNRLVEDSMIRMDNLKHIHLTEEGHERAVRIYEKHTYFMNLFMRLGMEKEKASEEACSVEHAVSDEAFEFIKESFGKMPCGHLGFCPGMRVKNQEHVIRKRRKKTDAEAQAEVDTGERQYAFPGDGSAT
jgi:Mn-dependent DtxR family transcriptional regulator